MPDVKTERGDVLFESVDTIVTLQGMAIEMPEVKGHPNKMPFSGVLTKVDEVSDRAPEGGGGKRVILTRKAAEEAIPTLLGMPVDFTEALDGHNVKKKIGTITEGWIDGNDLHIKGFFYAFDFPEEVQKIKAMRSVLGFSWELAHIYTPNVKSDPMVITGCVFTGAAVLRKDKAAYQSTSLAASATKGEVNMTEAELKALTDSVNAAVAGIKTLGDRLTAMETTVTPLKAAAHHVAMVEPHAAALEKIGAAMDKDGIGGNPQRGHVKACYAMASHLRAEASAGRLANEWPGFSGDYSGSVRAQAAEESPEAKAAREKLATDLKTLGDTVASLGTTLKDMKAASEKTAGATDQNAQRKTLTPQITALLAKAGITAPTDDKKLTVGDVDAAFTKTSLPMASRMEVKAALSKANLLAA